MENGLTFAALALASTALTFALIGLGGKSEDSSESKEIRQLTAKIDRLEKRLEIAEERGERGLRDSELGRTTPEDASSALSSGSGVNSSQELASRLESLGVMKFFEKRQEQISEDYEIVLDAEGELWTRLEALSRLKEAGQLDKAAVEAVLPLWEESFEQEGKGGHTRWSLLELLRGTTNPEFRTQVLDWIGTEDSPKMRAQGVQALVPMLPDSNVEEWLRHLAETDPEEGVRNLAARGLEELGQ